MSLRSTWKEDVNSAPIVFLDETRLTSGSQGNRRTLESFKALIAFVDFFKNNPSKVPKAVKKEVRKGVLFLSLCPFSKYRSGMALTCSNQDAAAKETENVPVEGGRQSARKECVVLYVGR